MEPSTPLVAVVLAGGDRDDRLAATVGAASKALVPLRDVPMGAYVAQALRSSGVVDRVIWVGATDTVIRRLVDVELPSGQRMVDSLSIGLGAALGWAADLGRGSQVGARADDAEAPEPRLLVVTADLPWWDAEGVEAFVRHAPAVDLVYPVVREADALARFPEQKRTYARIRDGRFTGGNAILLTPRAVTRLLPVVDAAFNARKRPWELARIVGFGTLLRHRSPVRHRGADRAPARRDRARVHHLGRGDRRRRGRSRAPAGHARPSALPVAQRSLTRRNSPCVAPKNSVVTPRWLPARR